jgi:hypothetical protein
MRAVLEAPGGALAIYWWLWWPSRAVLTNKSSVQKYAGVWLEDGLLLFALASMDGNPKKTHHQFKYTYFYAIHEKICKIIFSLSSSIIILSREDSTVNSWLKKRGKSIPFWKTSIHFETIVIKISLHERR